MAAFTSLFNEPQICMLHNTTSGVVSSRGLNRPDVRQNYLLYKFGMYFLTAEIQDAVSFSYKTKGAGDSV